MTAIASPMCSVMCIAYICTCNFSGAENRRQLNLPYAGLGMVQDLSRCPELQVHLLPKRTLTASQKSMLWRSTSSAAERAQIVGHLPAKRSGG